MVGVWKTPLQRFTAVQGQQRKGVLVVYIFSNTDPENLNNLKFFLGEGVNEGDGCEYLFVINKSPHEEVRTLIDTVQFCRELFEVQLAGGFSQAFLASIAMPKRSTSDPGCARAAGSHSLWRVQEVVLPALPANAKYVRHNNECYNWGTFGWALRTQGIDTSKYQHFIFMDSSVRGPFLPAYLRVRQLAQRCACDLYRSRLQPQTGAPLASLQGHVHWADVLLGKISDTVKLVGATINCEGSPKDGNAAGTWRHNPHVQSYLVATDQVGMGLLLSDQRVFECYENTWDTIYYSELGSSAVILDAGYNIDSLMVRYLA